MNSSWPRVLPRKGNLRFKKINDKSHWFEIYELNDLTYAFLEPYHWEEVISYLIIGEARAVLFDTGMGIGDIASEVTSITKLPIVVINSHSHFDHIGGNHQFDEIWSFENKFENDWIERGYSNAECRHYMIEGSYINLPSNVDIATFFVPGVHITKYLHHGETIDLGGRILTVHSTPGETPGAISLSDNRFNILFAGDLLYPAPIWMHIDESNWLEFSQSIDYIRAIQGIQHICPAHNEVCVSRDFVDKVKHGIESINNHEIEGIITDESLRFNFENFSILTKCINK